VSEHDAIRRGVVWPDRFVVRVRNERCVSVQHPCNVPSERGGRIGRWSVGAPERGCPLVCGGPCPANLPYNTHCSVTDPPVYCDYGSRFCWCDTDHGLWTCDVIPCRGMRPRLGCPCAREAGIGQARTSCEQPSGPACVNGRWFAAARAHVAAVLELHLRRARHRWAPGWKRIHRARARAAESALRRRRAAAREQHENERSDPHAITLRRVQGLGKTCETTIS
jgi:hypothetical protein